MNWDAIGAIGQAVSAVFLLLVVVQVRHARLEMTRSTRTGRTDTLLGILRSNVGDPSRQELRARVHQALGGKPTPFTALLTERCRLTSAEASVLHMEYMVWWQYYAEKVIRYSSPLARADLYQANSSMRNLFSSPAGSLWYKTMKPGLNPDAVRYMDNLLAQPG